MLRGVKGSAECVLISKMTVRVAAAKTSGPAWWRPVRRRYLCRPSLSTEDTAWLDLAVHSAAAMQRCPRVPLRLLAHDEARRSG